MPHQVSSITDLNQVPALVTAFMGTIGMGVVPFSVTYETSGSAATLVKQLRVACTIAIATTAAICRSPRLNNGNSSTPIIPNPTKLHLIGSSVSPAFVAGIVEYGFNLYRHFYFGYCELSDAYGGGEIVSGSDQSLQATSTDQSNRSMYNRGSSVFPFEGTSRHWATPGSNGGLRIETIPGTPGSESWKRFFTHSTAPTTFLGYFTVNPDACVIGGYGDSINDQGVHLGQSPYSGAAILVPINLYIGRRELSIQYFYPIGKPPGVRLINIRDIEPDTEITVGSNKWRVYPVFSKQQTPLLTLPSDVNFSRWSFDNSSFSVGMAYQVID